jgi:hypothetical protein
MRKKKSKAQQANEFIDERARHYKKLEKIQKVTKKRKKKNKKIKQRKPTPQNEHPLPDYHPNDIAKRWYGK